ncbi:conserved hypothetical protein [Ricinus communis]|uniref:Uncharacterized protein n=1 Tax=Ricinus communis TaxID=3988 RepID=B9RKZ6_RICCO|nr:conserved hypothetical protein [Ricinus communis]
MSKKNPLIMFLLQPPKEFLTIGPLLLHPQDPVSRPLCNTTLSFSIGFVMVSLTFITAKILATSTEEFYNDNTDDEARDNIDAAYDDDDDAPFND